MLNQDRLFVAIIKESAADLGISVEALSDNWLFVLRKDQQVRHVLGYDVGLNSSVAHRVAQDKYATFELLQSCGVECVELALFYSPSMTHYVPNRKGWDEMLKYFNDNGANIVCKPNEGRSGDDVYHVTTQHQLELAVQTIFHNEKTLVLSPFIEYEDEVRVIVLNGKTVFMFKKSRPFVIGDGIRTIDQLIRDHSIDSGNSEGFVRAVHQAITDGVNLDQTLATGVKFWIEWRHNLGLGSLAREIDDQSLADKLSEFAVKATAALRITFASVDIVIRDGLMLIMEINSGVMFEKAAIQLPNGRDRVRAIYRDVLKSAFHQMR